jgi:FkbM family methyltransferase
MGKFAFPLRNAALRNRPVTFRSGDVSIQMVPVGAMVRDSWTGLRHERHELSFILTMLAPGMVCFDVGASAGLFAISAAKKIGESGVFAFEPDPATADLLNRNLRLNGVARAHAAQIALGASTGGNEIFQGNTHAKNSSGTHESASPTTIDEFVREQAIPSVGLIRVGVGGAELMVLRGAKHLLERNDAPMVIFGVDASPTRRFGYHPVEILWLLESCGYSLFTLSSDTGAISELKPDYQYNSMVIAAKPGHPSFARLQARVQ